MKKLLLVAAIAICGAANAQAEKGSWVISGSTTLGFNNVSSKVKVDGESFDGPKTTSFNVTPAFGYFVANNFAIGLDLAFKSTKNENTDYFNGESFDYDTKDNTVIVMPTGTYYFKSASKVMPYLGAGIGYFSSTTKFSSNLSNDFDAKTTVDGLAWGANGGLVYLVTPSIGIDLGVGYINTSSKEGDVKTITNTFGVNAGFSIFIK